MVAKDTEIIVETIERITKFKYRENDYNPTYQNEDKNTENEIIKKTGDRVYLGRF